MTLEQTLSALRATGLVAREAPVPLLTDEPKIPEYLCDPSAEAMRRYRTAGVSGLGHHPDDTLARVKAAAECLERLCLSNPTSMPSPEVSTTVAGAFDPAGFLTYAPAQFDDHDAALREARECAYRWWPVTDCTSGEPRAVPAQMIFLDQFPGEIALRREHLSTGAALGARGTERALAAGILEAVERDAFIAAYLTRTPLRRIGDLPRPAAELAAYLRRYLLEPHVFALPTDLGVPTVLAITIDETGIGPAVNAGVRAALSSEEAILGALLESIQARRGIRLAEPPDVIPDRHEVTSLERRFRFWHPPERISLLDFWLEADGGTSSGELAGEPVRLEDCIDRLRERGYHVLVADVSLPEISRRGFEVVKVVIPELHPLYLDERAKALYSARHGEIVDDPSLPPHPIV